MATLESIQPTFVYFMIKAIENLGGRTDAGVGVPLFHYEALILHQQQGAAATQSRNFQRGMLAAQERNFVENACRNLPRPQKLTEPSGLANCHGWIFTGGRYGIGDASVATILRDNGYEAITDPRDGDVVTFGEDRGLSHSGLVRLSPGGEMQIESKWGPFGVYLHALEGHPFQGPPVFYRTQRRQHLLAGLQDGPGASRLAALHV